MFGTISEEFELPGPASEAWKIIGTLQLANMIVKELPNMIHKLDVIEGDGGVGTVLKVTFPEDNPLLYYKEKFILIDDEKKVKIAQVVEGGVLDLGFTLYQGKLEVIEKNETICINKTTIEYELKEEAAANASFVTTQPFVAIMNMVAKRLSQDKSSQSSA